MDISKLRSISQFQFTESSEPWVRQIAYIPEESPTEAGILSDFSNFTFNDSEFLQRFAFDFNQSQARAERHEGRVTGLRNEATSLHLALENVVRLAWVKPDPRGRAIVTSDRRRRGLEVERRSLLARNERRRVEAILAAVGLKKLAVLRCQRIFAGGAGETLEQPSAPARAAGAVAQFLSSASLERERRALLSAFGVREVDSVISGERKLALKFSLKLKHVGLVLKDSGWAGAPNELSSFESVASIRVWAKLAQLCGSTKGKVTLAPGLSVSLVSRNESVAFGKELERRYLAACLAEFLARVEKHSPTPARVRIMADKIVQTVLQFCLFRRNLDLLNDLMLKGSSLLLRIHFRPIVRADLFALEFFEETREKEGRRKLEPVGKILFGRELVSKGITPRVEKMNIVSLLQLSK